MLKKSKLILAISLLAQAFSFFLMFCILWGKKKSLANAFLTVSAMGGATGALLLAKMKKEIKSSSLEFDDDLPISDNDTHEEIVDELFELTEED